MSVLASTHKQCKANAATGLVHDTYQWLWLAQLIQPILVTCAARHLRIRQLLGA
jgi:hypothetical protein